MSSQIATIGGSSPLLHDLGLIDRAYGKRNVDLYKDVLKVSSHASLDELQAAFFQRRQELFEKMDGGPRVENLMDALILCYRIVGDAVLRGEYDELRGTSPPPPPKVVTPVKKQDRYYVMDDSEYHKSSSSRNNRKKKSSSSKSRSSPVLEMMDSMDEHAISDNVDFGKSVRKKKSAKYKTGSNQAQQISEMVESLDNEDTMRESSKKQSKKKKKKKSVTIIEEDVELRQQRDSKRKHEAINRSDVASLGTFSDEDTATFVTLETQETALSRRRGDKNFLAQAHEEIEGFVEDTLSAFDQVFHVFTLGEQDIDAVTFRIQKAKRDLTM